MESFYCCNYKSSNVNEQTYALFSSFFMFLDTDFRMKTKIEMNMYEYANKLICITWCKIQGIFISSKLVPVLFIFVEYRSSYGLFNVTMSIFAILYVS